MKKWIFPLVFIILELIFAILFLTPKIVSALPQFFLWIRDLFNIILTAISRLLHLPTFVNNGETNYIIANTISLFIVNFIIFSIYFISFALVENKRKKEVKQDNVDLSPKSEFDPVFFERRIPIMRLAFIWIPLNLWLLYYFLLNSKDMQENFAKNASGLYAIFEQNINFYNTNAVPLIEQDDGIKFVILLIGLLFVGGLYWIIFSFFAVVFKKPLAKAKANRALKEHEKRVSALQNEETFIENIDILEHAKFTHNKSIVDTIATIDIKEINEKEKNERQNYFDDLAQGIVDLGVEERKTLEVAKPNLERKPLRIVYPSMDSVTDTIINEETKQEIIIEKVETKEEPAIILDSKFDVLDTKHTPNLETFEKEEVNEEISEDIVKPLNPTKLRKPVKVIPVKPKNVPLKDLVNEDEVKVEDDND